MSRRSVIEVYMTIEIGSVPYIKGGGDGGAGGGGTAGGAGGGGGAFLQQPSHWQFSHVRSSEQVNSSDMWNQSRHFLLRHMLLHAGISSDTGGGGGEAGGEEGGGGGPGGDGGGEGDGGEGGGGGGDGEGGRGAGGSLGGGGGESAWQQPSHSQPRLASVLQLIVAVTPCHHRHVLPSHGLPHAGCAGGDAGGVAILGGGEINGGGNGRCGGQQPSHAQPCFSCTSSQVMMPIQLIHGVPWQVVEQVAGGGGVGDNNADASNCRRSASEVPFAMAGGLVCHALMPVHLSIEAWMVCGGGLRSFVARRWRSCTQGRRRTSAVGARQPSIQSSH